MKALIAFLALTLAFVGASAVSAAPTQGDLEAVILTREDVGGGYTVFQAGPLDQPTEAGVANYSVAFVRTPSLLNFAVSGVGVALADAEAADAAGFTPEAMLAEATSAGLTVTPIDSPGIGEESQRYAVSGEIFGIAIQGEAITWKQNGVRAAVFAMSNVANPSALPYAQLQSKKLQAAFGA